ncbi:MAG TPA: MFS transporter [Herpetosiphonaceae bacterium]
MSDQPRPARDHTRFNMAVNISDGAFFGGATGFASFVTVIPLFVSTLTSSALIIGLISAIHAVGWQLPQLLTANRVARLRRFKPMVLMMTLNERLPFAGLALIAWFAERLGGAALWLTLALLVWQGLGGGLTATAWQSMIGKIIPARRRGTFFGVQAAAANLFASGAAVLAGIMLERIASPLDWALCFGIAAVLMMVSWGFLAQTREESAEPAGAPLSQREFWGSVGGVLRNDPNFCWFLLTRFASQFATMASAFYTIYAVRRFGMGEEMIGALTAVFLLSQTVANPLMGWLGDRFSHRLMMEGGALAAAASALIAWLAPGPGWFFAAFALAGVANVAFWTTALAITLEFGSLEQRPVYIGLANTMTAPGTILAPLLGGWLADTAGYGGTFATAVAGAIATFAIVRLLVRDPRQLGQMGADGRQAPLAAPELPGGR